mmetsp:Transcript_7911/g.18965  ORF Transcript_7911/g.18965 Transcript_7911/m.18965 type:complete len:157 (-) Transcript_7911:27-497(-)
MDGVASLSKKHSAMKHEAVSVLPTGSSEDHPFAVQSSRHNQPFPGRTNCMSSEEFQKLLESVEHRESWSSEAFSEFRDAEMQVTRAWAIRADDDDLPRPALKSETRGLPGHGHQKVCKAPRWFTVKDLRKRVCSLFPRRSMPVSELKAEPSTDAAL